MSKSGQYLASALLLYAIALAGPLSATAQAQDGITLSLTPPFFQLTVTPGEPWSSSIKVVNVNEFPLTLYASVVNFEATGEEGKGKFTPLLSDDPDYRQASLAGWIDITDGPIVVSEGQSVKVPFSINTPQNASPGGHYAAILIGTEPVEDVEDGPYISVSTLISSLIFARVQGDINESGDIRELSTEKLFYQEPTVPISLRFENQGNVHLLPQGDITIYNMWGKERGKILVNHRTEFGNVLPGSVRKYTYEWQGEPTPLEAGRYTAVATLSFGNEDRQNVTRSTSFWVVPIVPVLSILGTFLLLLFSIIWFIKRYIRRALGEQLPAAQPAVRSKKLTQPIREGVMDLRNVDVGKKEPQEASLTVGQFVSRYKLFFAFIALLVIVLFLAWLYFGEVLLSERSYEVRELNEVDNYQIIGGEEE